MILVTIASMPTSNERTTKFPAYSALLKQKLKAKNSADKSKQKSTCLEVRTSDLHSQGFCCSTVEVSCLKMIWNEVHSLRKTISKKSLLLVLFYCLRTLTSLCLNCTCKHCWLLWMVDSCLLKIKQITFQDAQIEFWGSAYLQQRRYRYC